MPLAFKEDWNQAQERLGLWWKHGYFGRCAMAVMAPRDDAPTEPELPAPANPAEKWADLDYLFAACEHDLARTFFGGEAVPILHYGYPGREGIGAFLGCGIRFQPDTAWVDPILEGEDLVVRGLRIDPSNRWWRFTREAHARAAQRAKGKAIPSTGAFGASGDTLAWLRGTERLMFDCVERPDRVREAEAFLTELWCKVYTTLHNLLRDGREGSAGWFPLWAPGTFYGIQNDFSFNIGPDMFREIFLPGIRRQTEFLDFSLYHVDGVDAFRHVGAILGLPRLQAVQILPGAGKPSPLHYLDVLRKVQAAGKNLHITIPPEEVPAALEMLSARGLFIHTWTRTQTDAEALLRNAERWSVDRG